MKTYTFGNYGFGTGYLSKVDPQEVGEALEQLQGREGILTPARVVESARPKRSPLHDAFEWDDSVAAQAHREDQARHLIKAVRVQYSSEPEPRYAFVNVVTTNQRGYLDTHVAMGDPILREQVLNEATIALQHWRKRYHHLEELRPVVEAIDGLHVTQAK